jgi:hypothetical protein
MLDLLLRMIELILNYTPNDDLNKKQMLNILAGGLALVIRSEESPKTQGEMMSDVVKYLESELINIDSFSDTYFYKKNSP